MMREAFKGCSGELGAQDVNIGKKPAKAKVTKKLDFMCVTELSGCFQLL